MPVQALALLEVQESVPVQARVSVPVQARAQVVAVAVVVALPALAAAVPQGGRRRKR